MLNYSYSHRFACGWLLSVVGKVQRQYNAVLSKNRQSMTARGYCYYYLKHCSKTNHIAIKWVIKRAKHENVFGLVAY